MLTCHFQPTIRAGNDVVDTLTGEDNMENMPLGSWAYFYTFEFYARYISQ